MKTNKMSGIILIVFFLLSIFTGGAMTIKGNWNSFVGQFDNISFDNAKEKFSGVEDLLKAKFYAKSNLIDVYGLTQKLLGKNIVGNFEYIKDEEGYLHRLSNDYHEETINQFCSEMDQLKTILEGKDIPLLYVQFPARELEGFTSFPYPIEISGNQTMDNILSQLNNSGIDCLDMRNILEESDYTLGNVYYKTDIHPRTEFSIWAAEQIVNHLSEKNQMVFSNKDIVLNLENYNQITSKFLGNYGRSSGQYFTGLDTFIMYIPQFDTDLSLENAFSNINKKGTFEQVVMNGMEENLSFMNYWVINYLQYPSPYYTINNNRISDNNILIIMDSMGLTTASYLTLVSHNITVVDTRQKGDVDYINYALENNQFDAVIVLQGDSTTLLSKTLFPAAQ